VNLGGSDRNLCRIHGVYEEYRQNLEYVKEKPISEGSNVQRIWLENLKGKDELETLCVCGKTLVVLEWTFYSEKKNVYWISVIPLTSNVLYVALPRQNYAESSWVEAVSLNLLKLSGKFNYSMWCSHRTDVFRMDLRTNSNFYLIQLQRIGVYNRDRACLLCGTD
jgi:hypothetical protein